MEGFDSCGKHATSCTNRRGGTPVNSIEVNNGCQREYWGWHHGQLEMVALRWRMHAAAGTPVA